MKRQRLDEAKKTLAESASPKLDSQAKLCRKRHLANLSAEVSNCRVWEMHILAWFWNSYAFSSGPDQSDIGSWFFNALEVSHPTLLLKQALRALSVTRFGRANDRYDIVRQGHQLYGSVLKLLQETLYDKVLMCDDETLVSTRMLALYEVPASSSLLQPKLILLRPVVRGHFSWSL
jgi:hypothetical protein